MWFFFAQIKKAKILFKNSGELKSDIVNSGMSILAMLGGKVSKKGGALVKNLAKNHPETVGKRMFVSLKNGIKTSIVSIPRRISSVFKKNTWLKAYQGFQKAYNKAKSWGKEQFQKKKPVQNDPMRYGPYEEQVVPDRMHEKPLQEKAENKVLKELEDEKINKKEKTASHAENLNKLITERKQECYHFYKKYSPELTHADILDRIKGIDFNKPVKIIRVPPDGLGPEGNELYQFTKVNTEGKTLGGQYYTDKPKNTPSQLGVSEKYNVRDANGKHSDMVKTVTQEKIIFDKTKPMVGLKSTAAPIDDTWSLKNGQPVPTPGGAEQIYIPYNQ